MHRTSKRKFRDDSSLLLLRVISLARPTTIINKMCNKNAAVKEANQKSPPQNVKTITEYGIHNSSGSSRSTNSGVEVPKLVGVGRAVGIVALCWPDCSRVTVQVSPSKSSLSACNSLLRLATRSSRISTRGSTVIGAAGPAAPAGPAGTTGVAITAAGAAGTRLGTTGMADAAAGAGPGMGRPGAAAGAGTGMTG